MALKDDIKIAAMTKSELRKQGRITVSNELAEALIEQHGPPGLDRPHGSTHRTLDYSAKPEEKPEG